MERKLAQFFISDAIKRQKSGWTSDFILSTSRITTEPLPWGYASEVIAKVVNRPVRKMLDIGTGDGNFLSMIPCPKRTSVTEGHPPNVLIAQARLAPLSIDVFDVGDFDKLPFDEESFELVISRHSRYLNSEIYRVLEPGCYFVTQQVGSRNDLEINSWLESKEKKETWNLELATKQLEKSGMKVLKRLEAFPKMRIYDIGALVFHLSVIPWQITDFTIEDYYQELLDLHNRILEEGYIETTNHRFLIVAIREE